MLHLLRNLPPRIDGRSINVEGFFRLSAKWAAKPGSLAGFWTRRRPRLITELKDGSVYFVVKRETVFRMPFVNITPVREFSPSTAAPWNDAWAIVCRPETTLVEARLVHRLQGWRYLAEGDAPRDLKPSDSRPV